MFLYQPDNIVFAMEMLNLTQNQYMLDEVLIAFLTALLKKNDLPECYYWLNEIQSVHGAMMDMRKMLLHIYYDFYYSCQPTLVEELRQLDITEFIEKLFHLNSSPRVFILCQTPPQKPTFTYIKKTVKHELLAFCPDERLHDFIYAVHKTHYDGICYHAAKLLRTALVTGEEIVKALCSYYKMPFRAKMYLMRDDLQYVLAVYANLQQAREELSIPSMPSMPVVPSMPSIVSADYCIPPSTAAFKLTRWLHISPKENENEKETLTQDPILIAFALALPEQLTTPANLKAHFAATVTYIKTRLTAEEMQLFTGMPDEADMYRATEYYNEIWAEQQLKLQRYITTLSAGTGACAAGTDTDTSIRLPELMPMFGTSWLRNVFPAIALDKRLHKLVQYRMLDILY